MAHAIILSAFWKVILLLGGVALQWFLARNIGPEGLGNFVFIVTLLMGLQVLYRFGADQALLRVSNSKVSLSKPSIRNDAMMALCSTFVFKVGVISSLALLVGLTLLSRLNLEFSHQAYMAIPAVIASPFLGILSIYASYLRVHGVAAYAPFWEQAGISSVTLIILYLIVDFKNISDQLAVNIYLLVGVGLSVPVLKYVKLGLETRKRVVKKSWEYGVAQVFQFFHQWGLILLSGFMLSAEDVAFLSTAIRLSMLITLFLIISNGIISSRVATLSRAGNYHELKIIVKKFSCLITVTATIALIISLVFSDIILRSFGEQFVDAKIVFVMIIIAQWFNCLCGPGMTLLNMIGCQRFVKNVVILSGVLSMIFFVPVSLVWGVEGVSVLVFLNIVFTNIVFVIKLKNKIGFTSFPGLYKAVK